MKKQRKTKTFRPRPGWVCRTQELSRWTSNPTRLAKRLVDEGQLVRLAHGLYMCPKASRFGTVPPTAKAIMDAFLGNTPYVFTGPEYWNRLGLGSTALFPGHLVYNTKRTGEFDLAGRRFYLRRVRFPKKVTPEWYAIDLIEHRDMVGLEPDLLYRRLRLAVEAGRLNKDRLIETAGEFGTKETQKLVRKATTSSPYAAP